MTRGLCQQQAKDHVRRLQARVRSLVEGLMSQLQTLEALAGAPEAERRHLAGGLHQERSRLLDEYWTFERQSSELGRLYAASCRLHETLDPEEIIEVVRETAAELTGCERMALYEADEPGVALALSMDRTRSGSLPARIPYEGGAVGLAIRAGHAWMAAAGSEDALGGTRIEAVAPLLAGGRVCAALVLFDPLTPTVDLGCAFELLRTHAGAALRAARLTTRPRALQAV